MITRKKSLSALWPLLCAAAVQAGPPQSSKIVDFPLAPKCRPRAIVSGPDGAIWLTTSRQVTRVTSDGKPSEIPLPVNLAGAVGSPAAYGMIVGPDRNLWGTSSPGNAIFRMTPAGQFTVFSVPTPNASPRCIALGPDGNFWFTEFGVVSKIGRLTVSGEITEFATPTPNAGPYGIAAGSDGAMWFAEYNLQQIGRISMKGEIKEFPTPKHGDDGPGGPRCMVKGSDGAVWFTEWRANKIARSTTKGEITEFDIPTPASGPIGIAVGPDGNIWFCENKGGKIGCLTMKGVVTEHVLPAQSEPIHVTAGSDGNIWFVNDKFDKSRVGYIRIGAGAKGTEKK